MTNRLADAVSPYLRSHADNPVDWWPWGPEAFAEAARRDVPVLVSIGYSTCHWCHVMARESFSDPELAAHLNERFVAIKVDREEHPDVDSSYLAAASAFTPQLGWPLTVFTTPAGQAFFAGTYFPPQPVQDHPAFRQVLDAVTEAWTSRRGEVDATARGVAAALAAQPAPPAPGSVELPSAAALSHAAARVAAAEDVEHGGFGGAPKFPVAPAQLALLGLGAGGDRDALALASRTLRRMASSPLRDPVEGGFFRYSTRRDWGDPHYERMLYDNALLLTAYSRLALLEPADTVSDGTDETAGGAGRGPAPALGPLEVAAGIAGFLLARLRTPRGAFGSAQDSESTIDGRRVEGGFYALDAVERARHEAPPVDDKVLTGWNGLAIAALAEAGARHDRPDWVAAARGAADVLLDEHVTSDGRLRRASSSTGVSEAVATLEDHGMFAEGLLQLTLATGLPRYAVAARSLMSACLVDEEGVVPFAAPAGPDPVLRSQGTALAADPSEGAYPSGVAATAVAALTLHRLTGDARWRRAAERAVGPAADTALDSPVAYGTTFSLLAELAAPSTQLLVVEPSVVTPAVAAQVEGELSAAPGEAQPVVIDLGARARRTLGPGVLVGVVDEDSAVALADAGFELFAGRTAVRGHATAFLCHDFVCRLPVTGVVELDRDLAEQARSLA
ncbi:thioredoxin domain-containing protein [Frigoribacterium sp. CFBP 13729]|uniref:thioredoxin domain-containing protein n=1 Tax=Frigoribacterium sp. CFBP 13729 TaxID=2775293 RepID=UPI00177F4DB8|nr:DUF255 domain-containing protein [Frigoribacterium sp. CFBP 13729]MBD8610475.1 thioredoxin domain-containing protein [Frigoribacterium sp. CFBP 13729]